MYAKDRSTPRILTWYTRRRKYISLSLSLVPLFFCYFLVTNSTKRETTVGVKISERFAIRGKYLVREREGLFSHDGSVNFHQTVPRSGRRSYHRFVAATVSSFKKGTPRVLGWKDIFSQHISLFVQGARQQSLEQYGVILRVFLHGCRLSSLHVDIDSSATERVSTSHETSCDIYFRTTGTKMINQFNKRSSRFARDRIDIDYLSVGLT